MGYAGFEGIRYLRYTATIPNEFKPKMAHLQRSNCSINTNLNILAYVASTKINCIFFVGSFLFSVPNCALMMAVSAFSQGQLSRTVPVGSSDSHGRSGARSGRISSVRSAPPRPCPADDRSDCRSDRSFLSDGAKHPPELATAGRATGKRHAAAPPIGAECVACVVGGLGALLEKM